MNKKLLHGILIGLGVMLMLFLAFPIGLIISLAFWIHLGVMYWKKKGVFNEEIDSELSRNKLKRFKILSISAGLLFIIAITGIIMHNVRSGQLGAEEYFYFIIGIVTSYLFILVSAGGLIFFIKESQKSI